MHPPCRPVTIVTPKRFVLDGLLFGGNAARRAVIFVHGLGSSAFSHHKLLARLAARDTAVLAFNNRGHDVIANAKRFDARRKKGYGYIRAGKAHEVFTDCRDDIQGAVDFLSARGMRELYLMGHSTGSQKTAYYLSRGGSKHIKGAALLCPISDYASERHFHPRALRGAERIAHALVKQGRPHALLPGGSWHDVIDAQRFLSLYTPESEEEIFTYAQPKVTPRAFHKLTLPLLVVLAEYDQCSDRPARELAKWFASQTRSRRPRIAVIPRALHGLDGHEARVAKLVRGLFEK